MDRLFSLLKTSIDFSHLSWLGEITPNPAFLSSVAAFEAVVIAFLVPLSIEITSRISERYKSDVITRSFNNNWQNRCLPPFLLINIVAAVILRFFVQDDTDSTAWKIAACTILIFFMYIAFIICRTIKRLTNFMSDPKFVIDQLYKEAEKSIK